MKKIREVVITGVGAVTNQGTDAGTIWEAMREGRSGISTISDPAFKGYEGWNVAIDGAIEGWDPYTRLDKREAKRLDRCAQLGLFAAQEAIEHSGLDLSKEDPTRCGVV
ncbi:MAG TPA: beta-ketoacyl-[acyl-carrier-protein] synthase II, partial [Phycisphaerales bacterium]|nr:beta-ketoacyl-[acyl-carrier-protein] synthase II [Phycisphaerales bacterium]